MSTRRSFLSPLAPLYRAAIAFRNRGFDAGKRVVTFDRPVISVGNLSTGGTGKTPFTMHLIDLLREAGFNPCVAMRGYGAPKGRGHESDEAREYLAAFPDLPLVAQPDRTNGLIELFGGDEESKVSPVILDDGFQHRQIARQLNIVLMDATRSAFQDSLLPAGSLREPVESLARADVLVVTHVESGKNAPDAERGGIQSIRGRALAINPRLVVCECEHVWKGFVDANGAELSLDSLSGSRVFAVCAIGNPGAFLEQAGKLARAGLAGKVALRDHDPYSHATIASLSSQIAAAGADTILTTNKDWSKLQRVPASSWPACVKHIVRPRLVLAFSSGEAELKQAVLRTAATTVE